MKNPTVFYSWQSEQNETRNYIEKHLRKVIKAIGKNSPLELRPEFDKDTLGELGAPDILQTVKEKIEKCSVLAADLSIIGEVNRKKIVNQNVMFELGYMIGSNSEDRLILLFNKDLGDPKEAPFDIAHHRLLEFSIKNDPDGKEFETELMRILKPYLQNAQLESKIPKTAHDSLGHWEKKVLELFKSINGEKRLILSRAGRIGLSAGSYNTEIANALRNHADPQEIRAAFSSLVDKKYLECSYTPNSTLPHYRLLQKGYDYINQGNQR